MASGRSEADSLKSEFCFSPLSSLHLFALFTLAVSHPLFAVLGQADHLPFFVAHQSRGLDITILVLFLSFVIPALICVGLLLIRILSMKLAGVLFLLLIYLLFFAIWLPIPGKFLDEPGSLALILPSISAALATLLYIFKAWARSFVTALSLAIIISPVMFYFMPSVQSFMSSPRGQDFSVRPSTGDQPNIVMIIFDELPLNSLLQNKFEIDAVRYPNFHRLSTTSNWYRNAITNHYATSGAIASLLVGDEYSRYVSRQKRSGVPSSAILDRTKAPDNLFSLLENQYDIAAIESTSRLALENESALKFAPPLRQRITLLLTDALVIYAHFLVPDTLRYRLPVIEGQWMGFVDVVKLKRTYNNRDFPGPAVVVKQIIDQIHPTEYPAFYYLHVLLPHFPFMYTDQGIRHSNKFKFLSSQFRKATGVNNWPGETVATLVWQAHLMQVGYTDLLLGRVLDRLDEKGMFDETLLIVTADHGLSFYWNSGDISSEKMSLVQASETLNVPLFVKLPGQNFANLSKAPVQTIDILPTIAEIVGIDIPWEIGGISLLGDIPDERSMYARVPGRRSFGSVIDPDFEALRYKTQVFGSGNFERAHYSGPHAELVGEPVTAFQIGESVGTIRIDKEEQYSEIEYLSRLVPVYVEGEILFNPDLPAASNYDLAVTMNGIIKNTIRTTDFKISSLRLSKSGDIQLGSENSAIENVVGKTRNKYFLVRLPVESYVIGENEVNVYVIFENDNESKISLLPFEKNSKLE